MPGLTSLYTAVSGMNAARASLAVVGHNMANVNTAGYTRQRIIQHDSMYQIVGRNNGVPQQIGLGTDYHGIQQIRNKFLDISYREEVGKAAFYYTKSAAGRELETILGELQSDFQLQSVFSDIWAALQELSTYQPGLETRGNFVSTAVTFLNKADNVYGRLTDYQNNLNDQIKKTVQDINTLTTKIYNLNQQVIFAEVTGDRANDWRDQMNLALDELSALVNVDIKFDTKGNVIVMLDGNELIANGNINRIGLKYTAAGSQLVEPVFTNSMSILPHNAPLSSYRTVYTLTGEVNSYFNNDKGFLKGLLVSRGYSQPNYLSPLYPDPNALDSHHRSMYNFRFPITVTNPNGTSSTAIDMSVFDNFDPTNPTALQLAVLKTDRNYMQQYDKNVFDTQHSVIAKALHDFDKLVHAVVTMINDAFTVDPEKLARSQLDPSDPLYLAYDPPHDLNGDLAYTEIFIRKYVDRYDPITGELIPEDMSYKYDSTDPFNTKTLYTLGNIKINPALHSAQGYTLIGLSKSGDIEDQRIVLDMLDKWQEAFIEIPGQTAKLSIESYYRRFVTDIATKTNESANFAKEQDILVMAIENKRHAMSAVSLDEEMEFMMKFQHSYNAAARIVNVIDEMIERIINMKR